MVGRIGGTPQAMWTQIDALLSLMISRLSREHRAIVEQLVKDLIKLEQVEAITRNLTKQKQPEEVNCSIKATLDGSGYYRLTVRQKEVLSFAAEGYSDKRIAYRLGINVQTVKHHLSDIRDRLGALNSSHAVAIALTSGLISVNGKKVRNDSQGRLPYTRHRKC